ncbi:MAG: hypothetical protein GY866_09880 [Proteobacteria bacterium]|nr:hypothetical protein [Pseudomonadota bacterium]
MNLEEAIKTALEYEDGVVDVYGKYGDKFKSTVARKVFKILEEEEKEHVNYLKAKLAEWQESGKVTLDQLETKVPDKETIKANVKKLKKAVNEGDIETEIEAFQKALDLEIKTSDFYKEMVAKLPAGDQSLFKRFVEIEEGHEAIVQAEIDNARGLGFWFDFAEFDLESA